MSRYRYVITSSGYSRWDGEAHAKTAGFLFEHSELDPAVEMVPAGSASAGGIGHDSRTWLAFRISARHTQAVVDAMTYHGFEEPVPWRDVTLDEHDVAVAATKDDMDGVLDDVSWAAFLGVT